ncbi:hypothetical protein [Phenylobacterium sp.]|nr:hypothetical protein [Phenylobacterium sp.]MBX3484803.1 hypothetical protein [Phenylobacterium sp.]MCW5759076.1 hypothetical protein [Phenylobacterium sp.]
MTDKSPPETDEQEAERRFQETLGRLVNTPHKKHETLKERGPKPAPRKS